jgi:hypothetical protein
MTIQLTAGISRDDANINSAGLPVVGSDAVGGNLVLRSTSNNIKGAVILDETTPSISPNSGALQVLGGVGIQHSVTAGGSLMHVPFGQSLGNVIVNSGFGGAYSNAALHLPTTAATGSGSAATLTFPAQTIPPFIITWSQAITGISASAGIVTITFASWGSLGTSTPVVGQRITISDAVPTGYNGTFTVLTASTTQVTVSCAQTGAASVLGRISSIGEWITVAGLVPTGYTGTYQPINCTTTTVTYQNATTGAQSTAGIIFNHNTYGSVLPTPYVIATSSVTMATPAPLVTVQLPQTNGGIPATLSTNTINYTVITTAASGTGSVVTLTFNTQPAPPFPLGSLITVANLAPSGYNGQFVVTGCTTTTVTYASAATGAQTVAGTINCSSVVNVSIINPGTGYNSPPQITFQDPSPVPPIFDYINTGVATGTQVTINSYLRVQQTNGTRFVYQVVRAGTTGTDFIAGNSVPTQANGYVTSGNCTLLYIGTIAQGFTSLGYSGIITQGAIHQVGGVVNCVIQTAGSGFTAAPLLTFSPPQMPGGRPPVAVCTISGGAIQFVNVIDTGSGYLYPPTVTITSVNGVGTGANIAAVIGSPGEKPIVSYMPRSTNDQYTLDFGMNGHNVVFLTTGSNSTVFFDNQNASGAAPFFKGFPIGRKITLFVKATAGVTMTFTNLVAANSSSGANTQAITSGRTAKFEFTVLSTGNPFNQAGVSPPGGTFNDVYGSFIAS